jgi:hypothetical protein
MLASPLLPQPRSHPRPAAVAGVVALLLALAGAGIAFWVWPAGGRGPAPPVWPPRYKVSLINGCVLVVALMWRRAC